jgi:uncharacterized repeat protein (TIGR01451 family)
MRISPVFTMGGGLMLCLLGVVGAQEYMQQTAPSNRRTVQYFSRSGKTSEQIIPAQTAPPGIQHVQGSPVPGTQFHGSAQPFPTQTTQAISAQAQAPIVTNAEHDYYNELFGKTGTNASAGHAQLGQAPAAVTPVGYSEQAQQASTPVPYNDMRPVGTNSLPPSSKSNISAFDNLLLSPSGTVKQVSQHFNPNAEPVKSAGFTQSSTPAPNPIRTVSQLGNGNPFPFAGAGEENMDLDADEPADIRPAPKLGNPVIKAPLIQNASTQNVPSFDWSNPPSQQPFPGAAQPPFQQQAPQAQQPSAQFFQASSTSTTVAPTVNAQKNEIMEDQFQPFEQKETIPASPNQKSTPLPPWGQQNAGMVPAKEKTTAATSKINKADEAPTVQNVISTLAPAGPSSPMVTIQWKKRDEISVGQAAVCDLIVENSGTVNADNVIVEAQFPETVRLQDASPAPEDAQDGLIWMLGTLPAGKSRTIQVTMVPLQSGDVAATAHVRFTGTTSGIFAVRQPILKVVIEGPKQVMIGDPAPHTVTLTNPGTGIAKNVVVQTQLPPGLDHPKGKQLALQIGTLNPGETRTIRLALAATGPGSQGVQVMAVADGGLIDKAQLALNVLAPSLNVVVDGPGLRYKGRNAIYGITVKNTGTIASNNIKMMQHIPMGMDYISSDRGATFDSTTRMVSWFIGRLGIGESSTLNVKLMAKEIGEFKQQVRVTSEQGTTTDGMCVTRVEGVSSLTVDVSDIDDPVEVGEETAYEIKLTNEGSKEATNVVVDCDLPAGVGFLSAEGPTDHIADIDSLAFRPVTTLAPGKSVSYRIFVRGQKAGESRLRVKVSSDNLTDPIVREEMTRFYADKAPRQQ